MGTLGGKVQVTFGAAGTGDAVAGGMGTISPTYPTGITSGMILLLQIGAVDTTAPSITTPSGWTALTDSGVATGRQRAYWKVADGTETGTLAVTITQDSGAIARIYRMSAGSGIEAAGSARTAASGTGMSAVNVTTTGTLECAVQMLFAAVNTTIGDIAGESGADYTEAVAEFASATSGSILSLQTATAAAPATITGGSATLGAAGTERIRIGFAILP